MQGACGVRWVDRMLLRHSTTVFSFLFAHPPNARISRGGVFVPHVAEVPFVFGTTRAADPSRNFTRDEEALARMVTRYWVDFAKNGSPNGGGRPFWPPYTAATDGTGDAVLRIQLPAEGGTRAERGVRSAACDLQEQIARLDTPGIPGLPPPANV